MIVSFTDYVAILMDLKYGCHDIITMQKSLLLLSIYVNMKRPDLLKSAYYH